MVIPPAGILYFITVGYFFLKRQNLFTHLFFLCVLTEFFFRRAYLVGIGESYISLELCSQYLLVFYCVFHLRHINKKFLKCWLLLVLSYFVPIVLLALFPSDVLIASPTVTWDMILSGESSPVHPQISGHVFLMTVKFLLFGLVFLYIYQNWNFLNYKWAIEKFSKICNLFLYIGLFEFVLKNLFRLNEVWGDIMLLFFGERESTVMEGRLRGDLYELTLFTQEASHYAYILMVIIIIKLADNILNKRKSKIDIFIIISLFLMAFSTSFSAVYMAISFFSIYLAYRWYIQKPKYMRYEKILFMSAMFIILSSISVVIAINVDSFVFNRLINLYDNFDELLTMDYGIGSAIGDFSTQIRLVSSIQTIRAWLVRPFFGFSLGTIDAHSGTAMFLSSVGLIGLFCWIRYYFFTIPLFKVLMPKLKLYCLGIFLFLIIHLLTGTFRSFFGITLFYFSISYCCIFSEKLK